MSFLDDLFSTSKDTTSQQTTNSNSSSQNQGTSQSNIWPQLQSLFTNVAANSSTLPFNKFQTGAADSQAAATGYLTPGFGALTDIASGGLSPTAYQPYLNSFLPQLTSANQAVQNTAEQQALDNLHGNLAVKGALGNNTGTDAALASNLATQFAGQNAQTNANAFNTAQQLALQGQGQQISAAGGLGSLLGQYTGANTNLANIGNYQQQWPLQQQSILSSTLSPYIGASGQSYSSSGSQSGTSTGTGTSETTSNPSLFQDAAGLAGFGASLFGAKSRGAIERASGGAVEPFHAHIDMPSKVAHAFEAFHGLKQKAKGGVISRYDDGGVVSDPSWGSYVSQQTISDPSSTQGDDIVDQAKSNQLGMDLNKVAGALGKSAGKPDAASDAGDKDSDRALSALNNQASSLSAFMARGQQNGQPMAPLRGYAEGGDIVDAGPDKGLDYDAPDAKSSPSSTVVPYSSEDNRSFESPSFLGANKSSQTIVAPYSRNQPSTPRRGDGPISFLPTFLASDAPIRTGHMPDSVRMLYALSGEQIGLPAAKAAGDMVRENLEKQAQDRLWQQSQAQLTGEFNGQPTAAERHWIAEPGRQLALKNAEMAEARRADLVKLYKTRVDQIQDSIAAGLYTPQQGHDLLDAARQSYSEAASEIATGKLSKAAPVAPIPAVGARGTWSPTAGVQINGGN